MNIEEERRRREEEERRRREEEERRRREKEEKEIREAERNSKLIDDIQQLQNMEKDLYFDLEKASAANKSVREQTDIINKINDLSRMRINLFEELNKEFRETQVGVAEKKIDLVDQMTITGMVENQLNQAKENLQHLDSVKNSQMRMVEINTYYSERYRYYISIIQILIIITAIVLVLFIIYKKEWIPRYITLYIILGVVAVGIVILTWKIIGLNRRNNMDFNKIDWKWNSNDAPQNSVFAYDKKQLEGALEGAKSSLEDDALNYAKSLGITCIGDECCSKDMKFDKTTMKCVDK